MIRTAVTAPSCGVSSSRRQTERYSCAPVMDLGGFEGFDGTLPFCL